MQSGLQSSSTRNYGCTTISCYCYIDMHVLTSDRYNLLYLCLVFFRRKKLRPLYSLLHYVRSSRCWQLALNHPMLHRSASRAVSVLAQRGTRVATSVLKRRSSHMPLLSPP